jgi:hypothetical protein
MVVIHPIQTGKKGAEIRQKMAEFCGSCAPVK